MTYLPLQSWMLLLALVGQWASIFGMPALITPDRPSCGCCPIDQEAQLCCCQSVSPTHPVKSCCAAGPAKLKSACCVEPTVEPTITLRMVGGVERLRCQGHPDDHMVVATSPSIASETARLDWLTKSTPHSYRECVLTHHDAENPPTPPPRDGVSIQSIQALRLSGETSMTKAKMPTAGAIAAGC